MAKLLLAQGDTFHWVCDNENKIGRDIYGVILQHHHKVKDIENAQIMIVVSSIDGKDEIKDLLQSWNKKPVEDYWFFA
jgi:hypothetical protein